MQAARRVRYFQMRRWDRQESGQVAADSSFVRVCGESEDPRLARVMQDWCADKLAATGPARPKARRTPDPDLAAVLALCGDGILD